MKSTSEDFEEVSGFYSWSRDYWIDLSRSATGEKNNVLNFGYWLGEGELLCDAQMNLFRLIQDYLGVPAAGDRGVEIGCGIGGYAVRVLQQYPVSLTCYDLLEDHLALARDYAREHAVADRLTTVQGNAMDMARFNDGELDFGYCIESSFHYSEKQKFFNEVHRVLKPGGSFVYADISCEDIAGIGFRSGNYFSPRQELEDQIRQAGFDILEHRDIGDQVYLPLNRHIRDFNNRQFAGMKKPKLARYWELVSTNYAQLHASGKMGYQIYKLQK